MRKQKYVRGNNGWGAQPVRGKRGGYFQGATELRPTHAVESQAARLTFLHHETAKTGATTAASHR